MRRFVYEGTRPPARTVVVSTTAATSASSHVQRLPTRVAEPRIVRVPVGASVRPASSSTSSKEPEVIDLDAEHETTSSTTTTTNPPTTTRETLPRVVIPGGYTVNADGIRQRTIHIRRPIVRTVHRGGGTGYTSLIQRIPVRGAPTVVRRPVHRVLSYRPRGFTNGVRRTYEYEENEEEAMYRAIRHEEARMQAEDQSFYYSDPDFQRIEANIVKKETAARQELEQQRFSSLTTYQSRSSTQSEVDKRVQQIVQQMMAAPSPTVLNTSDSEEVCGAKMVMQGLIDNVCQQDRIYGWHRNILKRNRRNQEPPVLHTFVKRPIQKHSEVLLNERVDFLKRFIAKKRSRFELEVELENGFIKRTRTGALACVPNAHIYARIGAPMTEDCMSIPESIPEPIPIPAAAVPNHASYYAQNEAMETDYHQLHHHHHHQHQQQQQPMLPPAPEDELELDDDSMDVKTDIRHSPRQAIRPHKYTSPTDMTLAVSTSTQKPKMIQSMRPCGVAIIPAKHGKDLKKNKPGRPSNKERRRMERKAAAELRKMAKKGPANHPTDEIDVNACHCLCRAPFDMKKFYLACSTCFCWFHGKCVGVTEKRASKMPSWQCPQCAPETARYIPPPAKRPKLEPFSDAPEEFEEEDPNALYCVCQTVYDTNAYYVGCDGCSNWFHPDCVGITIQEAEAMQSYICPSCRTTKTECPAESSQDAAPLSEPESNAIFTAVKTMLEQEGAHLFTNGHSECAQYSNACPNCDTLDELMDKFRRGSYANVRTFLDDIDMMQATVENAFGPASDHTLTMTNLVHVAKAVLDDHLTSS